jgi:predicted phage terminase large subunit-like protein
VAIRDSLKRRDVMDSAWYRQAFAPRWAFAKDQNAKGHYKNTATGFMMAVSAGARISGDRGDAIFVDDPNDAAESFSKAARDQIITWWDQGAANRLSDMSTGCRCIIQQRLHEEDLTGHIMATEPDAWDVLVIRQEYELPTEKDPGPAPTSLGWTDPRTEDGQLFFPARFPPAVVEGERRRLASSGYAGQHQQRPAAKEGEIFKRGFVQFYDPTFPLPAFKRLIMSWDTAFKEKQQNDPSCGLLGGETDRGIYLLDHVLDRMSYPALKEKAKAWAATQSISALLIEDKASGQSLIQELRQETSLPVVAVKVDTDKVSRAWAIIPTWEARRIFLPTGAPWVDAFLEELYSFPKAAHDDQVDAFTQLVNYLVMGGGSMGLMGWLEQEIAAMKAEGVA